MDQCRFGIEKENVNPHTPTKRRLCHDERFLNLWMNTPKVSFDQISDLPCHIDKGHFQSKLDDKSGYDHILFIKGSRNLFWLILEGLVFGLQYFTIWLEP